MNNNEELFLPPAEEMDNENEKNDALAMAGDLLGELSEFLLEGLAAILSGLSE